MATCKHGMAHPQVADIENSRKIWRVIANILNRHLRSANKRYTSGVRRGLAIARHKKWVFTNCFTGLKYIEVSTKSRFVSKKKEVKQSRYSPWRRMRERRYSSYSFTTSALDGVSGQRHAPAALYPRGKDPRYPLDRKLGGPQSRSWHGGYRKNPLPLPGIEPLLSGRPARSQTLYCLS
jgi:hypothetical protein